jgi:hypothetical protein
MNNTERMFRNSMVNSSQKFYLGLSLSSDEGEINEPDDYCYKRVEVNFKDFKFEKRFNLKLFKKEIFYFNKFPIFFEESSKCWGKIKSIFVIDEKENIWFLNNLSKERKVNKWTTVIFNIGEIKIFFE